MELSHMKIFLALYFQVIFIKCQNLPPLGNLITVLSQTEQAILVNKINSNINNFEFIESCQKDILLKLNGINTILSTSLPVNISSTDLGNINTVKQSFSDLINQLKQKLNAIQFIQSVVTLKTISTQYTAIPLSVRQLIFNGTYEEYFNLATLMNTNNYNIASINENKSLFTVDLVNFWNDFSTKYPNFLTTVSQQKLNSTILNAFQTLINIPSGAQGKLVLMARLMDCLNKHPTFITDLYNISQNKSSNLNSVQLLKIQPLIKYLTCNLLATISFDDVRVNMNMSLDYDSFDKIIRCNSKFLIDTISYSDTTLLTDSFRPNLISVYFDFIMVFNFYNETNFIQSLASYIQYLPSTKLNNLLMKSNVTFINLYKNLNLDNMYPIMPNDVKLIISKYITNYFNSLGNKSLTLDELNMLNQAMPDLNPDNLQAFLLNSKNYLNALNVSSSMDAYTWMGNCDNALRYLKIIYKAIINNNDVNVNFDSLKPFLMCKQDCDFREINSIIMNNSINVAVSLIRNLRRDVAPLCFNTIGKYMRPSNLSNINITYIQSLGSIPLTALFSTSELGQMNTSIFLNNITLISNIINKDLAVLLRNQVSNLKLSDAGALMMGQSMDYFLNKTSAEVKTSFKVVTQYIGDLSPPIKLSLLNTVLKNTTKQDFIDLMSNLDKYTAEFVSLDYCKQANVNVSDTFIVQLPDSCLIYVASKVFKSLNNLNSSNSLDLSNILPYVLPSSINSLSTYLTTTDTITSLLKLKKPLNSFVRRSIFKNLINLLKQDAGDTPDLYIPKLTDSLITQLDGDYFIEMTEMELKEFIKYPQFFTALNMVSKIPVERCCNLPYKAKQRFANYSLIAMGKQNSVLNRDDLDTLGPVLVSSFNAYMISRIDLQSLADRLSFFKGFCFYLNKNNITVFSNTLNQLKNLPKYQNDLESLLLDLGDLAIYFPSFSTLSTNSISSMIPTIKSIKTNKDIYTDIFLKCRPVSFNNDDNMEISNRISSLDKLLITLINKRKALSGRKKRQTSTVSYTCDELQMMDDSVTTLSVTDLQAISSNELFNCISFLGSKPLWNYDQASALINTIKAKYNSVISNIPDSVIGQMNFINFGFSSTQLSQLKITTTDTISVLGSISGWSQLQLNALAALIKTTFGLSSNILIAMNNLICGISNTDIQTITVNDFSAALPIISQVTSCSDMSAWYKLAQQLYTVNDLNTPEVINQIGSILGGIPSQQFKNISTDLINSIKPSVFSSFPASTLNSMTNDQISVLTLEQAQQILNSPVSNYLSNTLKISIDKQSNIDSIIQTFTTSVASKIRNYNFILLILPLINIFI